jgi:DnaJ-class molecular chaperone
MYDLAVPADKPGQCPKCRGTGIYAWGAVINGQPSRSGQCHSCRGTGRQHRADIARNRAYNRHKVALICAGWGGTD